MDIKIAGITEEIMRKALEQAKGGRDHILGEMSKAMEAPRHELGEFAPQDRDHEDPGRQDPRSDRLGRQGDPRDRRETGAKIDIGEDGTIKIAAAERRRSTRPASGSSRSPREPEVGQIYTGKVVKIVDFGAFVNFFGAKDGLVHVEPDLQRAREQGLGRAEGRPGVKVKLLGFDDRGKTRLSMKIVDQETGEDLTARRKSRKPPTPKRPA